MVRHKAQIRSSPSSRRGVIYVAANNGRIPNEGEFDFSFSTIAGNDENVVVQVAEVNMALGAVSYLVDNGYRVVFDEDLKTGKDISFMLRKIRMLRPGFFVKGIYGCWMPLCNPLRISMRVFRGRRERS